MLPLAQPPAIGLNSTFAPQPYEVKPIREVDNTLGFYGTIEWKDQRKFQMGVLYCDNRSDPEDVDKHQYGWVTKSANFYLQFNFWKTYTFISQYMNGTTDMGGKIAGYARIIDVDYDAVFLLLTKKTGEYRTSVRYDWFSTDDNSTVIVDNSNETGQALTLTFSIKTGEKDVVIMEYLYIESERQARTTIGYSAKNNR